jgi:hypothetical protein
MPVKIQIDYKGPTYFMNIERILKRLFKAVPPEHIIGLEKIVVIDKFSGGNANARGLYYAKDSKEQARIHIAFQTVFKGLPRFVGLLPLVSKILLGHVLYHEIGHHYHYTLKAGITKSKREKFSDDYAKKISRIKFRYWRFFFWWLAPIFKWLGKKLKK